MPGLTPACPHDRQSQKWDGLSSPFCLQPRSGTLLLPPVSLCKACTTWTTFCRWKRTESFRDVLWSRGREFYSTLTQHLTQRWQKCVENRKYFAENSLIIEKDVRTIDVNFIVIAVTSSKKKMEALLSYFLCIYRSLYSLWNIWAAFRCDTKLLLYVLDL
jgi:hypothetical protein